MCCALQMNNYMARFPAWNHSTLSTLSSAPRHVGSSVAGPRLDPFRLLGEDDLAPHGVCNLGVLLLDSASLAALLRQVLLAHCKPVSLPGLQSAVTSPLHLFPSSTLLCHHTAATATTACAASTLAQLLASLTTVSHTLFAPLLAPSLAAPPLPVCSCLTTRPCAPLCKCT